MNETGHHDFLFANGMCIARLHKTIEKTDIHE